MEGRANEARVRLLAAALRIPSRDVRVVCGAGSRDKLIVIDGPEEDEVMHRLTAAAG